MKEAGAGERIAAAVRTVPRTLRRDLWTADSGPRPRGRRPRRLSALELSPPALFGVCLFLIDWNRYFYGYRLGVLGVLVAVGQSMLPVLALHRPIPAWCTSILMQLALVVAGLAVGGTAVGGRPTWSGLELALQAWVLFLVALRSRPRVAVEALLISVATGLLSVLAWGYEGCAILTVAVLAIATLVGSALHGRDVARNQLVAQEELTAEERARRTLLEERARIARELHDVVAHHMSVISIQAQAAPHLVEDPSAELKENLESIRQNAKDALTELRQVLGVLRSEHPEPDVERHVPQPTLDRLDELVDNVRGAGLTVTTRTTGEPVRLTQAIELSAFRIIQEALSNAMRHAPGAEVRVGLDYRASDILIRVINTASARPDLMSPGSGHGLLGMRERAATLGGGVAYGATAEGGYEVTAVLPLRLPAGPSDPVEDTA